MFGPLILLFYLSYSPSSSGLAISSSPKDILFWHGLAYLKLLPEGSVVFSHTNSISGDFSLLIVAHTFPLLCMIHCLMAFGKSCGQCTTDYRKLFLCPFLDGSYSHSNLLWKTCMAFLVLGFWSFR